MSALPPASAPASDAAFAHAPRPWLSKLKWGATILAVTCLMVDLDEAMMLPGSIDLPGTIWPRIYEAALVFVTSHPFYLTLFIALWLLSSRDPRNREDPGRVTLPFVLRSCAAIMIAANLTTLFFETGHMQGRVYRLSHATVILWRIRSIALLTATAVACGYCARLSARLSRRNLAAQFTWLIGLPVILLALSLFQIGWAYVFQPGSAAMYIAIVAIITAYLWFAVLLLRLRSHLQVASRSTPP